MFRTMRSTRSVSQFPFLLVLLLLGALLSAQRAVGQIVWSGYAGNAQHTAQSGIASQGLSQIIWQTPVDFNPQFSGNDLLIHYGSPLITQANTVLVPVKTGAADGFRVEARSGANGSLLWKFDSDYSLPSHDWTPSYGPTLTPNGRVYMAGAGGTVYFRNSVDSPVNIPPTQIAFYGTSEYNAHKTSYNNSIQICTPLTSASNGDVYFGYRSTGSNPLGVQSGIARIAADGTANYIAASALTGGQSTQILMNCAPALSNDGKTVYIATNSGGFSGGYLVALDAATLATQSQALLKDPHSGSNAILPDDGTASPLVAPDGKVFFGVLENPFNSSKGWMLQFNSDLSQTKTPGAFGWDDTASIVPASMVASYKGSSAYLLMSKYNNYAGLGGDGVNKLAILDPNDTQSDPRTGAIVMKEVLSIAGVTPDPEFLGSHPDAVREWCINTAVVDPFTDSVLANSEDGKLYRWNLGTNTFTQVITLTPGIGEAYTPTLIGQDGKVYAINNATLFAVGAAPEPGAIVYGLMSGGAALYGLLRRRRRRHSP
jgi:hypothetical protein